MDSQAEWLDTLIRLTLRAGMAGQAPSPQVWEQVAVQVSDNKRAFEISFAPKQGHAPLAPTDYYPRCLPQHVGEMMMAFALRFSI